MSDALIVWTLKASVILLVAFAVTGMMRRASAAARHFVWTLALAGVLVLPALGALLPAWKVKLLPAGEAPPVAAPATPAAPDRPGTFTPIVAPRFDAVETARDAKGASRYEIEPAAPAVDLRRLAPLLWTIGAGLVLLRLLAGIAGVWWLGRRATMMTDAGWLHTAHAIARRFGLGRGVTLLQGDGGTVPMTWGVLQPVVWLPSDADSWDEERRTLVLAHELAHVRRRDALTQWIAHLALALNWFNPLAWMAVKRFRDERERACDDAVLELGTQPATYADHLLDIVRSHGAGGAPMPVMAMARRSQFEGRLLAILDGASRRGSLSTRRAFSAGALALAAVLPVAAIRGAPPEVVTIVPVADSLVMGALDAGSGGDAAPIVTAQERSAERTSPVPAPATKQVAGRDSLVTALRRSASDTTLRLVIAATASMTSDGDKADVLRTVLKDSRLDRGDVAAVLRATATITSDGDRADVLRTALPHIAFDDTAHRTAFLASTAKFTSDGDLAGLLVALLERAELDASVQREVIRATRSMTSDGDKASVLTTLARTQQLDDPTRAAYIESVGSMTSDGDRRDALTAILPGGATSTRPNARDSRPPRPAGGRSDGTGQWTPRSATTASSTVVNGTRKWTTEFELDGEHNGQPNFKIRISARDARISADGRRLAGVDRGGLLAIEHTVFPGADNPGVVEPTTRTARIRGTSDGMAREFTVNGVKREWDAEADTWLAGVVARWGGGRTD